MRIINLTGIINLMGKYEETQTRGGHDRCFLFQVLGIERVSYKEFSPFRHIHYLLSSDVTRDMYTYIFLTELNEPGDRNTSTRIYL